MVTNELKLLIRPLPEDGESLIGYLLRVSEANGYVSIHWLLGAANLQTAARVHSCIYRAEDMEPLAKLLGVDLAVVTGMAYTPLGVFASRSKTNYEVCGQIVSTHLLRPNYPKICPACLAENPFCRKIWELGIVTACVKHKCLLMRECPACREKLTWKRTKLYTCRCGLDWTTVISELLPEHELVFSARVANLLGVSDVSPAAFPPQLLHLSLMDLANLLFFINGQLNGRSDIFGKSLQTQLSNGDLHRKLNSTIDLFHDFPFNFFEALDMLDTVYEERKQKCPFPNRPGSVRSQILGGVVRTCTKILKGEGFDFLREAFQEYIDYAKLACLGIDQPPRRDLKASAFFKVNEPLARAAEMLRIMPIWFPPLVKSGEIRGVCGKGSDRELWFVNKKDVARLKERLDAGISGEAAGEILGVSPPQFAALLTAGILKQLRDPFRRGFHKVIVSRAEVKRLYSRFEEAARSEIFSGETYTSRQAAGKLKRYGVDFAQMVSLVLAGKIVPVEVPKGGLLKSVLYSKVELDAYCNEILAKLKSKSYPIQETGRLLGISTKLVRKLLTAGYLISPPHTLKGLQGRVSFASIRNFKREYLVTLQLSEAYGMTPPAIQRKLSSLRIEPVDTSIGSWIFVYKRTEIRRIRYLLNGKVG